MTIYANKPAFNVREKLKELEMPSSIAGRAMLAADTPQEQFNLIGAGRRNLIINGGFDVWQRGTTGSVVGGPTYVSADRWKIYVNTSTTISLNRQSFAPGQTEVPGNPKYYARFDWLGTASSQFFGFEQLIEGVQHGAGDFLTVSFYARTQFGDDMVLGVNQKFGSGGSADVAAGNFDLNMDSFWKKFVLTIPMPSISGKTIGSADNLSFTWFRTGTLNSYLDIANVQVELGKVATPFEYRSYGEELTLCKRYAQVFTGKANKRLALSGNGGNTSYPTIVLPVEMRGDPAITYSALSDFDVEGLNGGKNTPTNLSLNVTSTTAVTLSCTTTSIAGSGTNLLFSNSTGWMLLSAEL